MAPFTFNTTKSLVFEAGAAARMGEIAGNTLGQTVLLITDPGLRNLKLIDAAVASLTQAGHTVAIFDSIEADPSRKTLLGAVAFGRDAGASGVLGFGGGSSLDVAKLAALLLGSGEDLDDAWGVGMARGPRLPLVLVPTTAGTGSEVTPVSIITVGAEEKRGVSSPVILPDIAILDADLTVGLPPHITAATGVDAMVHAIEAYASKSANNNPLSKILAREALCRLGANIETAVFDGRDKHARGEMLLGSMLAGQAFANSPVAAVHALAYPVGSTFHIPHGVSNALLLPHVLRFNAPEAGVLYAEIAADAFPHLAQIDGTQARCAAFIDALADLASKLGIQTRLRDVDIPEGAITKMAADAMLQQRLLVNNPRDVSEQDAINIYKAAW
ncbi:MAG: iron-containing alcohol dehydrogenase [Pseudomonadota bacterium]